MIWCAVVLAPTEKLEDSKVDEPTDIEPNQPIVDDNSYISPKEATNTKSKTNEEKTLIDAIKPKHRRRRKASSQH